MALSSAAKTGRSSRSRGASAQPCNCTLPRSQCPHSRGSAGTRSSRRPARRRRRRVGRRAREALQVAGLAGEGDPDLDRLAPFGAHQRVAGVRRAAASQSTLPSTQDSEDPGRTGPDRPAARRSAAAQRAPRPAQPPRREHHGTIVAALPAASSAPASRAVTTLLPPSCYSVPVEPESENRSENGPHSARPFSRCPSRQLLLASGDLHAPALKTPAPQPAARVPHDPHRARRTPSPTVLTRPHHVVRVVRATRHANYQGS